MTTGLTFTTYMTQVAQLAVVPVDDANFVAIQPMMTTYAENRICRDLDFLQTVTTTVNRSTTASQQYVDLGTAATPDFIVLQEVNVITPAATTDPSLGTIVPLLPVTKEFLRHMYPSATSKATPKFFAMETETRVLFGPWPDAVYYLQAVGTTRPDSLSGTTSPTFISTYLPDLLIMASMVYISAFQRNFGAMANDPEMPVSYESQYQTLLKGAAVEEARKKWQSSAWSSMSPSPAATPSRGGA